MTNNRMLVDERQRDIGRFMVGRLLPFRKKRQVGPFTFIDHMGPAHIKPGHAMDIDQHPHIGLSTLTYLLKGEITHRDSTGAEQTIKAGDVGFMTAGKGVAHTERTPEHLREQAYDMHGYQIWLALPVALEEMEPNFQYLPSAELPTWQEEDLNLKLVAGEAYGRKSPLKTYSPLFMVHVKGCAGAVLDIKEQLKGEIAIVITNGSVEVEEETVSAGQMLISKTDSECKLKLTEDSELLLFGGQAFPEERFLYWNFVSHSKERLEQAKEDWAAKRFPKVPGDLTYIPLPGSK